MRFHARVNFGAPKSVGCVYRHYVHAHDLTEVNMASMDEELFLYILCCGQRNQLNCVRLTLLAHKSCQHRYWVHNILRKRKQFGCSSTRLIKSSCCLMVSFTHALLPFRDISIPTRDIDPGSVIRCAGSRPHGNALFSARVSARRTKRWNAHMESGPKSRI